MRLMSGGKDDVGQDHDVSAMVQAEPPSFSSRFWSFLQIGSLAFTGVLLGSWWCGHRPDRPLGVGLTAMLAISGALLL